MAAKLFVLGLTYTLAHESVDDFWPPLPSYLRSLPPADFERVIHGGPPPAQWYQSGGPLASIKPPQAPQQAAKPNNPLAHLSARPMAAMAAMPPMAADPFMKKGHVSLMEPSILMPGMQEDAGAGVDPFAKPKAKASSTNPLAHLSARPMAPMPPMPPMAADPFMKRGHAALPEPSVLMPGVQEEAGLGAMKPSTSMPRGLIPDMRARPAPGGRDFRQQQRVHQVPQPKKMETPPKHSRPKEHYPPVYVFEDPTPTTAAVREWCSESPVQRCKMHCPLPSCPTSHCAMRHGPCCAFNCIAKPGTESAGANTTEHIDTTSDNTTTVAPTSSTPTTPPVESAVKATWHHDISHEQLQHNTTHHRHNTTAHHKHRRKLSPQDNSSQPQNMPRLKDGPGAHPGPRGHKKHHNSSHHHGKHTEAKETGVSGSMERAGVASLLAFADDHPSPVDQQQDPKVSELSHTDSSSPGDTGSSPTATTASHNEQGETDEVNEATFQSLLEDAFSHASHVSEE